MAIGETVPCTRFFVLIGVLTSLVVHTDCRTTVHELGTVSYTNATRFWWFTEHVVNPCHITPSLLRGDTLHKSPSTASSVSQNVSLVDSYQSLGLALNKTLGKLSKLELANPGLPDCHGISLDPLPVMPPLDNLDEAATIKQAHKSIVFLTTHFHLMILDRKIPIPDMHLLIAQERMEFNSPLPPWNFQRCRKETERFPTILVDVTRSLEHVICTILTIATAEQTNSFRETLNSLHQAVLPQHHTSCSTLETHDCLVVRETKQSLNLISRKYKQLIQQSSSN